MCCDSGATFDLPPEVIEALAKYRGMLAERGWDWGDEQIDFFRLARFSQFGPVLEEFRATGNWTSAVRNVIATSFHPELAGETRFHRLLATMASEHDDPGEGSGRRPHPTRRTGNPS